MITEKCDFHGIPDCIKLSDGTIDIFVTTTFGPRIIGAGFSGGRNFMCEFADQLASIGKQKWQSYGGHRFWHAPEAFPRSYFVDNTPVPYDIRNDVVFLSCPEERENGVRKELEISLADGKVRVCHRLINTGRWEIRAAVWALTVMAPGGKVIVPQEKFVPQGCGEGHALLPARAMAMWPYTDMADPRFTWGTRFIEMRESGGSGSPLKFGVFNSAGYIAYELDGEYFVKRFAAKRDCEYPDFGCNCEFFTCRGMLEAESLSPLVRLVPGGSVEHLEEWTFFRSRPDFMV